MNGETPEAGGRRITVRDVAAHAGVSQATVSQVLSGSRPVAAATRTRVLASVEALGYRPNHVARALRQQKSRTVAIVVPNITHVIYPMVARGVSEILRPLGYQVALYDTDGIRSTEKQVVRTIADRMVDGAILFGYPLARSDAHILKEFGIAVVNGGLDAQIPSYCDTVRVDQAAVLRALTRELARRYGGPIAYIGGPQEHGATVVREAGFRAALDDLHLECNPQLFTSAPYTWTGGRLAMGEVLGTGLRPRVVICANDLIAIGAIAAARENGLRIPDDVAVSGYDNIDAAELAYPPLTTVEAYPFEQGRACARLLLERMAGTYEGPPRHLTLSAEVVFRASA